MKMAIIAVLLIVSISGLSAKRMAPDVIKPVIYKDMIIKVNHDKMGVIEIWNKDSSQLLDSIVIYKVITNPFLEKDVQDVFIKKIFLVDNYLFIINEKEKYYKLNLDTKKVFVSDKKEFGKYGIGGS